MSAPGFQRLPLRGRVSAAPPAAGAAGDDIDAVFSDARANDCRGDLDAAEQGYRRVLERAPGHAESLHNLGSIMKRRGRMEEARSLFRRVLALRPDTCITLHELAGTRRYDDPGDEDALRIKKLLRRSRLSPDDAVLLHFALGKIYDDCGEFERAFASYRKGNAIRHRKSRYDPRAFESYVDRVIDTFPSSVVGKAGDPPGGCELPVYVIGMPRSATTLVEQILSGHDQVHGAGELLVVDQTIEQLRARAKTLSDYPQFVAECRPEHFAEESKLYEAFLRELPGRPVACVIDKMPYNFKCVGLISMVFPRARFVHCQRDPRDVCLSNYFQLFLGRHDHTNSLLDLGHYYRQYERLMAHWRRVLPADRLHEIRYEELVTDVEARARAMVDFLGLEWDERCLRPERNDRVVHTASNWQVRQPVFTGSVHRWRNYEKFLGPLIKALGLGRASRGTTSTLR